MPDQKCRWDSSEYHMQSLTLLILGLNRVEGAPESRGQGGG